MDIDGLRMELDDIDDEIAMLIARRLGIVEKIGAIKKGSGAPVRVPEREQAIVARLKSDNPDVNPALIDDIMKRIFQESYRVEK